MTIRFRPAEADELVDNERAAQRIYMGSALTMEPGEHAPTCNPMQLPAAYIYCESSNPECVQPQPSALCPAQNSPPASADRSLRAAPPRCSKRPFLFLLLLPRTTLPTKHLLCVLCNVGNPAFVSRVRSPAYEDNLCIARAHGLILAVHLVACSSSWPIANVSIQEHCCRRSPRCTTTTLSPLIRNTSINSRVMHIISPTTTARSTCCDGTLLSYNSHPELSPTQPQATHPVLATSLVET